MKLTSRDGKRRIALRAKTARAPKRAKPDVVVFGVTRIGAFRGARFPGEQIELAIQAALSLKLDVFEAISIEMQELSKELPSGYVYGNGHAFLPAIKTGLYKRLHAASGGLVRGGAGEPNQTR